jgi:PRTRC genetic system protein A
MNPVGYLHSKPEGLVGEPGLGFNYILAQNGLFIEAENQHLKATAPIFELDPGRLVRGLAPLEPEVTLKHGLIPSLLWDTAWNILEEDPYSEGYVAITWGPTGYGLVVPPQQATAASVTYDRPRNLVVDIHSHGAMKPFFSGTDSADDQGLKLSIVIGEMDKPLPTFVARVCIYGCFAPVEPSNFFRYGENIRCTP